MAISSRTVPLFDPLIGNDQMRGCQAFTQSFVSLTRDLASFISGKKRIFDQFIVMVDGTV